MRQLRIVRILSFLYSDALAGGGAYQSGSFPFIRAGTRKGKVRVTIYEAGHNHTSRRLDGQGVARLRQVFHPPGRSDFDDDSIPN